MKKTGTKDEVWHGLAEHTKGGLTRHHLTLNKKGHVVSIAKHIAGKKNYHHTLGAYAQPRHVAKLGHAMLGGYLI